MPAANKFLELAGINGWQLVWRREPWEDLRARVVALDVMRGRERIWGGATVYWGDDLAGAEQSLCAMLLQQLERRGAAAGERY